MEVTEFDRVVDEYDAQHRANIAVTGEDPAFFAEYKIRAVQEMAQARGVSVGRILDFGAGIGNSVAHFQRFLPRASLTCADVSQRSLARIEARFPGMTDRLPIDGARIPAADGMFDLSFSACVFHHIPHDEHVSWLRELRRVTRPGGLLAVFEHNPLNPLTVRAVNTCPFDANARLIRARQLRERCRDAGWQRVHIQYHVFFPRALAGLRPLERHLTGIPLGAQYSVAAG